MIDEFRGPVQLNIRRQAVAVFKGQLRLPVKACAVIDIEPQNGVAGDAAPIDNSQIVGRDLREIGLHRMFADIEIALNPKERLAVAIITRVKRAPDKALGAQRTCVSKFPLDRPGTVRVGPGAKLVVAARELPLRRPGNGAGLKAEKHTDACVCQHRADVADLIGAEIGKAIPAARNHLEGSCRVRQADPAAPT